MPRLRTDTDWISSKKVGIPVTDEQWADLGRLIATKTTLKRGESLSYGRFIADTLLTVYKDELALIAKQREELAARLKGA